MQDQPQSQISRSEMENRPNLKQMMEAAEAAERSGDALRAARLWENGVEAFPDNPGLALRFIKSLKHGGHVIEAERAARQAARRFPAHVIIALELGWVLAHQKRWIEALLEWEDLLIKFPSEAALEAVIATGLSAVGRHAEAEMRLQEAIKQFPNSFHVALEHAAVAGRLGLWNEAARRWQRLVTQYPDRADLRARFGASLAKAGDAVSANEVLEAAAEVFPDSSTVAIEYALVAQPDWPEAARRWANVHERFPTIPIAWSGFGGALRRSSESDRAEEILARGQKLFPDDIRIGNEFAGTASDRRDWIQALARWRNVLSLNPGNSDAQRQLAEAQFSASLEAMMDAPPPVRVKDKLSNPLVEGELSDADMLLRFEGLGENCEFGLVQRYYGAEPLGLLRFAGIQPENLLTALGTRFSGVGASEYTILIDRNSEYVTADRRFGLSSHTFIRPSSTSYETCFADQCKRISYLKNKLLEDLEDGEKIFTTVVFTDPSEAGARALHAALRQYGPGRLLYVRADVPGKTVGEVEELEEGIFLGYLDSYGNKGRNIGWDISYSVWLEICRKALALVRAKAVQSL